MRIQSNPIHMLIARGNIPRAIKINGSTQTTDQP